MKFAKTDRINSLTSVFLFRSNRGSYIQTQVSTYKNFYRSPVQVKTDFCIKLCYVRKQGLQQPDPQVPVLQLSCKKPPVISCSDPIFRLHFSLCSEDMFPQTLSEPRQPDCLLQISFPGVPSRFHQY